MDLHNCEGFSVYTSGQRRIGLTGTQTEVVSIERIGLINPVTQIVQLRVGARPLRLAGDP